MKNRNLLTAIASLLLVSIALAGCAGGVSQDEHDALQAELTDLQGDYAASQAGVTARYLQKVCNQSGGVPSL